jgi:hypothetical protein
MTREQEMIYVFRAMDERGQNDILKLAKRIAKLNPAPPAVVTLPFVRPLLRLVTEAVLPVPATPVLKLHGPLQQLPG